MKDISYLERVEKHGNEVHHFHVKNGNNAVIKYIVQSLVVIMLMGLGGWNLKKTSDNAVEVALLRQALDTHFKNEKSTERKFQYELNKHEKEIDFLQQNQWTPKDSEMIASKEIARMQSWVRKNFVEK